MFCTWALAEIRDGGSSVQNCGYTVSGGRAALVLPPNLLVDLADLPSQILSLFVAMTFPSSQRHGFGVASTVFRCLPVVASGVSPGTSGGLRGASSVDPAFSKSGVQHQCTAVIASRHRGEGYSGVSGARLRRPREEGTCGDLHLRKLAAAGLTHVQLLPNYDFGSVPERQEPQRLPAVATRSLGRRRVGLSRAFRGGAHRVC